MSSNFNRRQVVGSLAATGAMAGLGKFDLAFAAGNLVITIYGGRYEKFWNEQLLPTFRQKTGTQTVLDIGIGSTFMTKLRAADRNNPPYSFLMVNEIIGTVLRAEGYFEPWPADKVPNLKNVHPKANLDNANQGVTVMFSPIGIAYRSDLVKTPPKSWKDLWNNPEFKNKIGLYEIANTAGYNFLLMTSKIYGKGPFDFDAGFSQVEKLKPFPQAALAGAMAVLLTRGEIVAGPLDISETLSMQKKGVPVAWAAPSEGMFMFDQTFSLLKNAPNKDAACAFLDYMLSEEVQAKLAQEFQAVPSNKNVKLPPEVAAEQPMTVNELDKIVAFDWAEANKLRDGATERWNRLTR